MPSIQWGATSTSILVFTPTSSALNAYANGAGTLAFLAKPVNGSGTGCDLGGLRDIASGTTGNWYHALSKKDTPAPANVAFDDDNASITGTTALTSGSWYILAVEWPSGTGVTPRFHIKNLTAATAWVHEAATGTVTNKAGPSPGFFHVGYHGDFDLGSGAQISLAAAWNVALGDTNAAALNTNLKTSDWYNSAAGKPVFLSEITTLTPSDLIGGSTFSAANSTTTGLTVGGDPAGGWTFDGTGAIIAPPPQRAPLGV